MDELTELTRLAAAALDLPCAAVNLVDGSDVCTLAGVGVRVGEVRPRALIMCDEVIRQGVPVVYGDLSTTRFADTAPPGIRFYAGWPLHAWDGAAPVATLCVMDTRPRRLGPAQRRTLELLAAQAADRLRPSAPAADRLRDDFIALVSHEVRTPLASIQGYVEMLLDDLPLAEPRHRRFAGSITGNVQRLVRLIDQLLLTATASAGNLTPRPERIDLSAVVIDVVEEVRPLASKAEVALELRAASQTWLLGDRALLAQAVDNLVRNGIRFTLPGGRVQVTVGASGGLATVEIVDSGVGIPKDEQDRVFDRFFRGAYAQLHAVQGAGLGLALVKAVAEAHGAQVHLNSAPDRGTRVELVLPTGS